MSMSHQVDGARGRAPQEEVLAAPRLWWEYARAAALATWAARRAPLTPLLLRQRREYIDAYRDALVADAGGPPLSAHARGRLRALEEHGFAVEQARGARRCAAGRAQRGVWRA